jgi:hypothetical protein
MTQTAWTTKKLWEIHTQQHNLINLLHFLKNWGGGAYKQTHRQQGYLISLLFGEDKDIHTDNKVISQASFYFFFKGKQTKKNVVRYKEGRRQGHKRECVPLGNMNLKRNQENLPLVGGEPSCIILWWPVTK